MHVRWLTILLLALMIGLARPPQAHACSIMLLPLDDLLAQSELIVEGTVVSHFSDQHGAEIQVARIYKGEGAERITVNPSEWAQRDVLGNVMITSCYDTQASFSEGEEVMLFLQPDPEAAGWRTVGMFQGKVTHQGETLIASFLNNATPEELASPDLPHRWDQLQSYLAEEVGEPHEPTALPAQPSEVPLWAFFFAAAGLLAALALAWQPLRQMAERRRAIPSDKIG